MPAVVDPEKCEGCGDCVDSCPTEAISIQDEKAVVNDEDLSEEHWDDRSLDALFENNTPSASPSRTSPSPPPMSSGSPTAKRHAGDCRARRALNCSA